MNTTKNKYPLYLEVKSQTKNLIKIRKFIFDVAMNFGFDDETANRIALAVDEACTNIIMHSYKNIEDKPIQISVMPNKVKFEVIIVDYGGTFDPDSIKSPDMKEYMKKYKRGGLGIYLMRSLVDKVEYNIGKDNKNEVRLIKYRN